ncbi:MAG: DUF1801 domain-containing protein [Actinobacteria bacterium]|nr:DUF1801 domain-containing protein [Actinomycetota bacterium]MBU1609236.1 DUF1801 domain-containing protein [Actinomycetota bacterium]MBU2315798.1 DUF1801 domain-containing protein [Actinomycetota bacterium]MBU2384825.1 DUF1801 domain-containing protein [Actinomycetota bacterium]
MTQKTLPTDVPVEEFFATLDARRSAEGAELVEVYRAATGAEPVMWGPSIVGFGEYTYRYASGHEGVWLRTGFSPRKAKLSLYGLTEHPDSPALLDRLGPHTASVACVYVTRLSAIDLDVLRELVALGWTTTADSAV